ADPWFRGGISVAAGDLNGDGLADILAGAGIGGGPVVAVFDPKTGLPTASIFAFDEAFRGGVNVAAVDVNGDGKAEVLAAPGPGLPPQARLFGGPGLTQLAALNPFPEGSGFLGGIDVG